MATLNKIMVIGNVGRDPEMRVTGGGKGVAQFSLAVNRKYSTDGEQREETEWFQIICWGKLGELAQQLVTKGRLIYVEGRLQTRKWNDREGKERTGVEIVASDFQLLDSRREREAGADAGPAAPAAAGDPDGDEIPF